MSLKFDLLSMAAELEVTYSKKENILKENLNSYVLSELQNAKAKVEFFKKSISSVSNDPTLVNEIHKNYTKDKEEIILQIARIKAG